MNIKEQVVKIEVTCAACNGAGKIIDYPMHGATWKEQLECPQCNGTGKGILTSRDVLAQLTENVQKVLKEWVSLEKATLLSKFKEMVEGMTERGLDTDTEQEIREILNENYILKAKGETNEDCIVHSLINSTLYWERKNQLHHSQQEILKKINEL